MKNQKQIYLMIYIGPWGLSGTTFKLSNKKPDPRSYAHGEGNCLVFRMIDGDFSPSFHKALYDGTIMAQIGDFGISANLDKLVKKTIPEKKKQREKKIQELKKKGFIS